MRVEYTVPGWQLTAARAAAASGAESVSFEQVLRQRAAGVAGEWQRLVGVEQRHSSAPILEAPAKPSGYVEGSVEQRRLAWRAFLESPEGAPLRPLFEERLTARAAVGR
ncbi:MAG TPA: hypothetical protein DEH78_03340 [Solibacterales bacterium]|nr:hypothetical protein [Bryobacterales bacterium]